MTAQPLVHHGGTMFEVAKPKRVAVISCPAATNLLLTDSQLKAGGSFATKVTIESRVRQGATELVFQDPIDDVRATTRLLSLEFHGAGQDLGPLFLVMGLASITS